MMWENGEEEEEEDGEEERAVGKLLVDDVSTGVKRLPF